MQTCSQSCPEVPLSRGLCTVHYQRARYAGTLDEIAPNPSGDCEICGKPIQGRRWGSVYCSTECKEAARRVRRRPAQALKRREDRAARVAALGTRHCVICETPLPEHIMIDARCCSKECRVTYNNRQQAAKRREVVRTEDRRCGWCDGPIPVPESGRIRKKYCSYVCKKREMGARYRERSPGYMRGYKYGLGEERYQALLAAQGGVCAICGTAEWGGKTGKPHVDHDHGCNHMDKKQNCCPACVRGLLCDTCNRGIGVIGEDPARLRAAADYLERAAAAARMTLF